jgi:DNA-binding helix-hairpin-helix protein with protein kinase domain
MNRPPNMEVVDTQGRAVRLGREIGRGGEASVFQLASNDSQLAKIYHSPVSREKADKIRLMSRDLSNDPVAKLTAWPSDLLLKRSGEPVGLLMPKFNGRDIHRLYSPKSRRADFQRADWRFLVHAAANTARAFGAVHDAGCIIGDVNHGGVLVAQDATVRLIDCDSFQVRAGGRQFLCEVGVETFTPPELQGKPFKGVVRTESHDNFGLAVMVFLMLFMGRHPFAGRYLRAGDMSIPKAIEESRFAYGVRRSDAYMERPPGTPPLSIVGDDVAMLFELAFSKQMIGVGRPTAREWIAALNQLEKEFRQCTSSSSHWYQKSNPSCPWCQMEVATGIALFPIIFQGTPGTLFDIDSLWRQVEALPHPGPAPAIQEIAGRPSEQARAVRSANVSKNWIAGIVGLVMIATAMSGALKGFGAILFFGGIAAFFVVRNMLDKSDGVRGFRLPFDDAAKKWDAAKAEWLRRAGPREFDQQKAALQAMRQNWSNIPNDRIRKLDQLRRDQHARQLEHFLDQYEIDDAKIDNIGPGRKRTLESYGIETAADISKLHNIAVPGIGQKLQSNLFDWRESHARRFRFDPRKPINPLDIAQIEQEVLTDKKKLEDKLRAALAELKRTHNQVLAVRQQMRPHLDVIQREYAQAAANYNAARGA